ncbi:MAG: hypothetical protein AAF934_09655 [Bacteroidota bacterium]
MEALEHLQERFKLYQGNHILLSNDELIYYSSSIDVSKLSGSLKSFIEDSEQVVQASLKLNIEALAEAEQHRDEAEQLRKESENREARLKVLNEKLEQQHRLSELELIEERKARHAEKRLNFQRLLIYVLGGLIGLSIVLSHVSNAFAANDTVLNLTKDAIILLLQIFGMAASYVFGSQQKKGENEKQAE